MVILNNFQFADLRVVEERAGQTHNQARPCCIETKETWSKGGCDLVEKYDNVSSVIFPFLSPRLPAMSTLQFYFSEDRWGYNGY